MLAQSQTQTSDQIDVPAGQAEVSQCVQKYFANYVLVVANKHKYARYNSLNLVEVMDQNG